MATDDEPLDAEFKPLAIRPEAPPQLLDALRPADRVALMAEIATVVKDVIEKQRWFKQIGPKKHIRIEGWTFIAGLGGCTAKTISTEKVDGGFKAHAVVVRVDSGVEVGSAEQVCMSSEYNWKGKDDYALIGMASTRACSRALSTVFRHVVELAGYSATPAEEMVKDTPAVAPEPPSEPGPTIEDYRVAWEAAGKPEGTGRAFLAKHGGTLAGAMATLRRECCRQCGQFIPHGEAKARLCLTCAPFGDAAKAAVAPLQVDVEMSDSGFHRIKASGAIPASEPTLTLVDVPDTDSLEKERRRMFALAKDRNVSDDVRRAIMLRLFGAKCIRNGKPSSTALNHAQLCMLNFELENE